MTNATTPPWTQPSARELLMQVRDIVLNNPERHNQGQWVYNEFGVKEDLRVEDARAYAMAPLPDEPEMPSAVCGTTACVAGWTVILGSAPGTVVLRTQYACDTFVLVPDQERQPVPSYARDLLGLNREQAAWLFDEDRTREEVLEGLDALIADPQAVLGEDDEDDDEF